MAKDSTKPLLRRAPQEDRPDRRFSILLAAEKLFAQNGYNGVSIRQIAEQAGVPLALVGYYFGQKHELFNAIFEHWNSTIKERLEALEAIKTRAADQDYLEQVIASFVSPVLRLRASPEGEWYALLMTRGMNEPGQETDRIMRQYFDPMANAFIDALIQGFPGSKRSQIAWCYQFMLGALLHHLGDQRVERLSGGVNKCCSPDAAPLLTAFILGGMRQAMALALKSSSAVKPRRSRRLSLD